MKLLSFFMLPVIAQSLNEFVCTCHKPVDIAFLLDISGSISEESVELEKEFVVDLMNGFGDDTRFSIVSYNGKIRETHPFDYNKTRIQECLEDIPKPRGWTDTKEAIKYLTDEFLPDSRENITVFVVLLTDGVPVTGKKPHKLPENQKLLTIEETNRMKDLFPNTHVLGVGVGDFEKDFLLNISDATSVIQEFKELKSIIIDLAKTICV